MRQYYKSDKKRREDNQRKKSEQKRLKRLNKNSQDPNKTETDLTSKPTGSDNGSGGA